MSSTSSPLALVRDDLRDFGGYRSAREHGADGQVWLNANESADASAVSAAASCRRYPDPQPAVLRDRLAALYGCDPSQLLIGRGSDEAIDLLVRALCVPGRDAVVVTPPVFGMYAVSARLQGAPLLEVPLLEAEDSFVADMDAIADAAMSSAARLVFLCSPSNPTGGAIALSEIAGLASRLDGHALVVVDEAYVEFSDTPSAVSLLLQHRNIAVLRTLSKAHALAAARIGCLIADAELIRVLRACQAPYPVPAPCAELALSVLAPEVLASTRERIRGTVAERRRMRTALAEIAGVRKVFRSQGNFLLVRFDDAEAAFASLLARGVVVRDQRSAPGLGDALRISIGKRAENDQVLVALMAATALAPTLPASEAAA